MVSDETTLPGEVPSSGYMSSDKEGSYSQGPITIGSYHYTGKKHMILDESESHLLPIH